MTANPVPLIVIATVQGPASLEKEYHARFKEYRFHGEWFDRSAPIEHEILRIDPSAITRLDSWADAPSTACDCEICKPQSLRVARLLSSAGRASA